MRGEVVNRAAIRALAALLGCLIALLGVLLGVVLLPGPRFEGSPPSGPLTAEVFAVDPETKPRPRNEAFDVVFIPDVGYGNVSVEADSFLADVQSMIRDGFGRNAAMAANLHLLNFGYVTVTGSISSPCEDTQLPEEAIPPWVDTAILIHRATGPEGRDFLDCSWDRYGTANKDDFSGVVHEIGHTVFGLPDEYPNDGCYFEAKPVLFASGGACEKELKSGSPNWCNSEKTKCECKDLYGGNNACRQRGSKIRTWYRSEDGWWDVMGHTPPGDPPEFGPADWVILSKRFGSLQGAAVLPPPAFAPAGWP